MSALHALLPEPITHRDLKAANVLVKQRGDEWLVKVADFGLAKMMDATGASSNTYTTGTLAWSAPETFCGQFGASWRATWTRAHVMEVTTDAQRSTLLVSARLGSV